MKACLISLYTESRDYPSKISLSSMRLAAYVAAQHDLSDLELKIVPLRLDDAADDLAQAIMNRGADVVGLPGYIWTSQKSREIAQAIFKKSPKTLTIVGGPETATFDYQRWPNNTLFVLGEGEKPLVWILRRRAEDPDFIGDNSDQLHQAIYSHLRDRSRAVIQMERNIAVGVPIYSDEFMNLLENQDQQDRAFTWYDTMAGCLYKCGYCGHKTRHGVVFRPDAVVEEEIQRIGHLGFKRVFVIDPVLGGIPERGDKILGYYQKYAPDTGIIAYYRPEHLCDTTISILELSNIEEILIGLQSTNPDVPGWLRSNNLTKVTRYLPQLSQRGIFHRIELITGLPGDTPDGQRESLRFVVEEIQPMSIWSYPLTVIPGTQLYGILDADQRGQALWVHADPVSFRATESSSYTSEEMDHMLVYAGAVTSLYNILRKRGDTTIRGKPINLDQIEQVIRSAVTPDDLQIIKLFRSSDMVNAMRYWDKKI